MKTITVISREMLMECQGISLPELWKNQVDDLWHRGIISCPVCRTIPCLYEVCDEQVHEFDSDVGAAS